MNAEEGLRDLLDERDRYLDELEGELQAQEAENDKQRDELLQCQDKIAQLQTLLKQQRQDNDDLIGENGQLQEEVKAHKSQLDAQKNVIAAAANSSEELQRVQRDGNKRLHRLELENERLRATVMEIEENEDILVNEIDTLVSEKTRFQEKSEELTAKCDALYADVDEKARTNALLLKDKERAEETLESEQRSYRKDLEEWKRRDAASSSEITRLLAALEKEKAKHDELAYVRESNALRKELIKVRKEKTKLQKAKDQCVVDKNQAERDLDSAIQVVNELKRNAKEQVALANRERAALEAESNTKSESVNAKLDGATKRFVDVEEQLEDLREQLERCEARNTMYEGNHGLTEVVRAQKQLEADIRRRDYDLKRVHHTLGVQMEKNRVLSKACDWLKEKANLGQDFAFDDEEIKAALESEDNRLQSENAELVRQIEAIEAERTKLLSHLRERAAEIGEKGVRFLGMSSDQVAQVMEFASNVRQGNVELPLTDRSKELMSEIASLKSEREVNRVTIERLERELFTVSESSEEPRGDIILQQAHNSMIVENQQLRDKIRALEAEGSGNRNESSLTPLMRERAKDLLGAELVSMPAAAELQLAMVMEQYDKAAQELAVLTEGMAKTGGDKEHVGRTEAHAASGETECKSDNGSESLRTTASSMERSLQDLRNERDMLLTRCKSLEVSLKAEGQARREAQQNLAEIQSIYNERVSDMEKWKVNTTKAMERQLASVESSAAKSNHKEDGAMAAKDKLLSVLDESFQERNNTDTKPMPGGGAGGDGGGSTDAENIANSLRLTQGKLAGYIDDVARLRGIICAMQETRIDTAKIALQVSCLNDIIHEKNRIIQEGKQKLATAKQMKLKLARGNKGSHERMSDRSISTNSIDRSILRAAANHSGLSPTRTNLQKHLEDATNLVFEKEGVIEEQNRTIENLKEQLESVSNEAESMRTDISTLVSRLAEAESSVNAIGAYQQKCDEAQGVLESNKNQVKSLKSKISALTKEASGKEAKINELTDALLRSKRVLSVARQGRARSEENLKAATEEVTQMKEQLKKAEEQMNVLKKEKVDAQNAKVRLSQKARLSATKLKDLVESSEKTKTTEELEKRVNVLNKTVSGLAATNSKLRGELAASKLLAKKKAEEELATPPVSHPTTRPSSQRASISRGRPMSARSKSLELQVKDLQKSLSQEKQHASSSSAVLERYQKRINALEQALTSCNSGGELLNDSPREQVQQKLKVLTSENKALKERIRGMTAGEDLNGQVKLLRAENESLKKENERLSQIDHLNFFEEIEDLKYKYNEAVRQINQLTTG